jgi:HAD superfamily phosphoserine phosphatase-like hydrolase
MTSRADDPLATIPRASAGEILARMEAELSRVLAVQAAPGTLRARLPGAVIASDADGTLWDGDVGIELFEALLAARGARAEAREALEAEARFVGIDAEGDAAAIVAALYEAYAADRYAHDRAFAMMAWVFAGWTRAELDAFCARVLDAGRIEARLRPELRDVFRWAEAHGVPAYVVSASPVAVVEAAVARLGLPTAGVVAMTPAVDAGGVILPRLAGPIVYGEGKLAALEAACPGARKALLAAFGDSAYDAAMLRAARVPVAVTPAPRLAAIAPSIDRLVLLAR